MYLKRLEMRGFKSFVNNIEIDFEPGIDIIVGPNGCGKSNLVDAIRWVLGESNIRHLRGHKSEDVIFGGTDKHKALGMAYVEMILDNSDNSLPIDYREVTIARKIFRSGESEFYLNKSRVRMKDITRLFSGTGLGKNGYSIISQGELEQVLNGQPLDRRLILEEASGIIKYRQQRDEVKRRISSSGNDLLRLQDILVELEQRKNDVYNKAEKAKLYLEKSDELQFLEKNVICFELARIYRVLKQKTDDLSTKKNDLRKQYDRLKLMEDDLQQKEERLKDSKSHLGQLIDKRHKIESSLTRIEGEIRLSEERINNNQERIKSARDDEHKYSKMLSNLQKDIEQTVEDYHEEEKKYLKKLEQYKKLDLEIREMENKNQTRLQYFEEQKSLVFKKTEEESRVKNKILKNEERIKKAGEKKEKFKIHIKELENKIKKHQADLAELKVEQNNNEKIIQETGKSLEDLLAKKDQDLNHLKDINKTIMQLNQENARINNRLMVIKDMQQNLVGYSPGVKAVLKASKNGEIQGIIGIMGEIINVPEGLELAVDIASGRGLENILVPSFEDARKAIDYIKQYRLGRVTFLPVDSLKIKRVPPALLKEISQEGILGLGSKLVEYDKRFEKAVEYLLGRVLIVKDIKDAVKVFKNINYPFRIVSLEGELINVNGAVTGGIKKQAGTSPLQRRGEERRLLLLKGKNAAALDKNHSKVEEISLEIKNQENKITKLNNQLMEQKFLHEIQLKQVASLTLELDNNIRQRDSLLIQLSRVDQELVLLEEQMVDLDKKRQAMVRQNEAIYQEIEEIKEAIDNNKREYEVRRERLSSYSDQLSMKKRELENMKKNTTQFQQVQKSYTEAQKDAEELNKRLQTITMDEMKKIQQVMKVIDDEKNALAETVNEITELQSQQEKQQLKLNSLRENIIPIKEDIIKTENQIKNLEIAIVKIEAEQENLMSKWHEKYPNIDINLDYQLSSAAQIKEYKKQIAVLHQQIEEIGPVDTESIYEYKEIEERFNFIKNQYDDLSNARDSLDSLLNETEKLMRDEFNQFLLLAAKSFNNTFIEIFGGGEAYLVLGQGNNHLETGVDIQVKMPGKKMQSLNLLSGGERALTCIAFAFSLLRLKPTPFCLFDEIDASLDDTNLLRFSKFIEKMAGDIQFIIITHRQGTIQSGRNIYGVTMHEEGISSVLAINIAEAESMAV